MPISRLNLSVRANTVCAKNGVETLADLLSLSDSDISNFHSCGRKTTAELTSARNMLKSVCCDFGVYSPIEHEIFNSVFVSFSKRFNDCVTQMHYDERRFILDEVSGPELLLRALIRAYSVKDDDLDVLNFNSLLNGPYVYSFQALFKTLAQTDGMPEGVMLVIYRALSKIMRADTEDNCLFELGSVALNVQICLRSLYEMEFNRLKVRVRNCLGSSIPTLDKAWPYIFGRKMISVCNIPSMGAKTFDEVCVFFNMMKMLIDKVVSDARRDDVCLVEYMKLAVRARYPFLTDDEAELPAMCELLGEPLPVFYLIERYVLHCTTGNGASFRKYYGFGTNQNHRDSRAAKRIAEQNGCVPYSVTSAVSRFVPYPESIAGVAKCAAAEVVRPVVPSYDAQITRIIAGNYLTCTPFQLMAIIVALNPNYRILDSPEADVCYLVRYDLLRDFHLSKVKQILRPFVDCNTIKDTCLSLRRIVEKAEPGMVWRDEMAELIVYFKDYYSADAHIEFVDCDTILIHANSVNLKHTCEQILRERGRIMSREEIISEFRRRYPHSTVKDVTLVAALTVNANIIAVGKSGRYGLKGFKNLFDGNVDDCIEMVLREQGSPLSLNDIFKRVRRYFPATTLRSISTYLSIRRERFVALLNGMYCMADNISETTVVKSLKVKRPFDVRFADFRSFVEKNNRLPHYAADDCAEKSLYLWLRNVKYGNVSSTPEQRAQITNFLTCSNLPELGKMALLETEAFSNNNVTA